MAVNGEVNWQVNVADAIGLKFLDCSISLSYSYSLSLSLSLSLSGRMESDEIRWNNDGIAGRETGRGKEQENGGESYLFDVHLGARRQLSITDVSFYYHFFNPPPSHPVLPSSASSSNSIWQDPDENPRWLSRFLEGRGMSG